MYECLLLYLFISTNGKTLQRSPLIVEFVLAYRNICYIVLLSSISELPFFFRDGIHFVADYDSTWIGVGVIVLVAVVVVVVHFFMMG